MKKLLTITFCLTLIAGLSLTLAPVPAHAFTIFGVRFFEKPTPTPTPTPVPTRTNNLMPTPTKTASPKPTPTPTAKPTPTPTPSPTPTPAVGGTSTDSSSGPTNALPHTGPAEDISLIILGISAGFLAHKFWQVSKAS